MRLLIAGGRVVDPSRNIDDALDILIDDGRIKDLVRPGQADSWAQPDQVISAAGRVVVPGLIDLHV
ncbi:MAG: dihydroorotase, partial [Deltaproteobacteria bacterium]|nr:dihydroorotase [Deltaproteobacteria bacterium]